MNDHFFTMKKCKKIKLNRVDNVFVYIQVFLRAFFAPPPHAPHLNQNFFHHMNINFGSLADLGP